MHNFLEKYQSELQNKRFSPDPEQSKVAQALSLLVQNILKMDRRRTGWWLRFKKTKEIASNKKGCYIWGQVGRGKTYLMDLFCQYLKEETNIRVERYHFHRFMKTVHTRLHELSGVPDPLAVLADEWLKKLDVFCFDEFYVQDVADALILGRLLTVSFEKGLFWLMTSNAEPDKLYLNGLQRSLFLQTIELMKKKLDIVELGGEQDYRNQYMAGRDRFHVVPEARLEASDPILAHYFFHFTHKNAPLMAQEIVVQHRTIMVRGQQAGVLWCDFDKLCGTAKSYGDYIEIAKDYALILLGPVPVLNRQMEDQARRFICLIDEFYDQNVKLIMTMAVPVEALYTGELLQFEFQRTKSRLAEMQTEYYWNKPHGHAI